MAGPTVRLTGRVSDRVVEETVRSARAAIVTSVEEFGIAAVEAQAAGRPVIARGAGGPLETVIDQATGCFWSGGAAELAAAVLEFDDSLISPEACVQSAARFSRQVFREGILAQVHRAQSQGAREPLAYRRPLASTRLARRAGVGVPG